MALEIVKRKDSADTGNKMIADRRFYVNADRSKVVEEGDPEAAFLFCALGKSFLIEEFLDLGGKVVKGAAAKSDKKAEDKVDKSKAEDKSKKKGK